MGGEFVAFNDDGERSLTKFQRLQRAIATWRGHPTNATLEQSAICCCIVTGQRNCATTTQIMTQDLLLSTNSRTSQGHAISSRRDSALGGSMMTDGFAGEIDFMSRKS